MEDENKSKSPNIAEQINVSPDDESLPKHDIGNPNLFKLLTNKKIDGIENDASKSNLQNISNTPERKVANVQVEEKHLKNDKKDNTTPGKKKLFSWLNKQMKIEMTDGRVLVGIFLCTDRDANVILGSCTEYLNPEVCGFTDEPRILGLVMVPGRHIVSIHHDDCDTQFSNIANMVMPEDKEPAGV